MKPIGISTEFIYPGKVGGTEYHAKNLIEGFLQILPKDESIKLYGHASSYDICSQKLSLTHSGLNSSNRFFREAWSYIRYGNKVRGMIFSNYFTPPWFKSCPIVTVIHDAQYWHMPQNFSVKKRVWLRTAHLLTLIWADTVIATSEHVKRDLLNIYGSRWGKKIKVIPIPVSWDRLGKPDGSQNETVQKRFVLSVATHYPHKNLTTLIRAFQKVRLAFPDVNLVLAGQLPEGLIGSNNCPDLRKLVKELGLENAVKITGHISNEGLAQLFEGAELFVFPSLFEGFGLPPVEALGFGLPVITTNLTSIPEVTLGMAKYLKNPLDIDEMAREIKIVLDNPAAHKKQASEIVKIRAHYSPAAIAKQYYELFQ